MKKLLLLPVLLAALLLPLTAAPKSAYAYRAEYGQLTVRILADDVYLYRNALVSDENKMFLLTKSYYLIAYEIGDSLFYEVEYQSTQDGYIPTMGYVLKSQVTLSEDTPELIFPKITASAVTNEMVRSTPSDSSPVLACTTAGQSLLIYGFLPLEDGTRYAFVRYGSKVGYIRAESLDIAAITPHPNPLPTPDPPDVDPGGDETPGGDNTTDPDPEPSTDTPVFDTKMQIILIVAIVIPALFIAYLMFRPGRKNKQAPTGYSRYS